ncbi:MAG: tetraacyldisaccharide 4'-kinase [Myxococcota bacterium]
MPEYLWRTRESVGRRLLLAPLELAEWPYRLGAWLNRALYERGMRARVRLPARVISIGNPTVGGSGKTPLVAWLAGRLRERGEKVAVLCRGIGGARGQGVNVVSDGDRVLLSPTDVGDEPVWLAACVPGVPVLAGRSRVALGLRASAVFGAEILLLDDGFQHHRVHRDLDLVCIDARVRLGNGHVLPRGPLREPLGALRRADALVWTRAPVREQTSEPDDPWLPPELPRFRVRMVPRGLRRIGAPGWVPTAELADRKVGVLAAIARPQAFERSLRELGAEPVARSLHPDHHFYTRADIEALDPKLLWVTTAKDAIKIPASWVRRRRVMVLEEQVEPCPGPGLVDWICERHGPVGWVG